MTGMIQVPFGNAMVSRIEPAGPAGSYKTYGMSMPLRTHWRPASCEEADCEAYRHGWVSTFDLATELGQHQAAYCLADKERSFSMQRPTATMIKFIYKPGNRCFRSGDHKVPLERPARFYVQGGDWRGNPMGTATRVHTRPEHWVEDFSEHQDRLATAIKKG